MWEFNSPQTIKCLKNLKKLKKNISGIQSECQTVWILITLVMYNAGPDLSFVGLILDQNCLQRLAVGRFNCGSIFICVFVFVSVLCLLIAVFFVAFIYIFFSALFLFLLVMQIDKLHPDIFQQQKLKNVSAAYSLFNPSNILTGWE